MNHPCVLKKLFIVVDVELCDDEDAVLAPHCCVTALKFFAVTLFSVIFTLSIEHSTMGLPTHGLIRTGAGNTVPSPMYPVHGGHIHCGTTLNFEARSLDVFHELNLEYVIVGDAAVASAIVPEYS